MGKSRPCFGKTPQHVTFLCVRLTLLQSLIKAVRKYLGSQDAFAERTSPFIVGKALNTQTATAPVAEYIPARESNPCQEATYVLPDHVFDHYGHIHMTIAFIDQRPLLLTFSYHRPTLFFTLVDQFNIHYPAYNNQLP